MGILRLNDKLNFPGRAKNGGANGSANDRHTSLLAEESFIRLLSLERRRAERSKRQFVLMLLHIGKALHNGKREAVLDKMVLALSRSTRETDLTGWYERDSVLGVILTEIDQAAMSAALNAVNNRVGSALRAELSLRQANDIHISFHLFPEEWDPEDKDSPADSSLYPDLLNDDPRKTSLIVKRAMDVVGSIIALIVLSPLFALISVAIKLSSQGPIFFKQERVGQYGRRFPFLKFRSMHPNCDSRIHQDYVKRFISGEAESARHEGAFKLTSDPRITPLGRFLRKTSLDELPQFLNVLRGEMSLVGPRPPIPYELHSYGQWHRRRLLEAKPGITGLWQVNGRSKTKFDDMVRLDLEYARTWTPWLDVKILWKTPRAVLSAEGAY
jgi:lipopolysaccharide/colanic/teichoic acid biosynthesis glycosyltransferase